MIIAIISLSRLGVTQCAVNAALCQLLNISIIDR